MAGGSTRLRADALVFPHQQVPVYLWGAQSLRNGVLASEPIRRCVPVGPLSQVSTLAFRRHELLVTLLSILIA